VTDGPVAVIDSEPPNPNTIVCLEEALAAAREGRISAVAIAAVYRDGSTGDAWAKPVSPATLIGAVSVLHARLIHSITDKD
jgi:hypothetical protein